MGSTDTNQPVIEDAYTRLLDLLQTHLGSHDFLLGDRPGRADFALFGQLKPMLWWDPTPMAIAVEHAPRALNWIERVDELVWEVDGLEYRQAPFGYQVKCLRWLREAHDQLDEASRGTVDGLLAGTGCDRLFA